MKALIGLVWLLGFVPLQATLQADDELAESASASVSVLRGWVVDKGDHITGIKDPRRMSNPAKIDHEAALEASEPIKEMRRKGIDPDSIEGRALRRKAAKAVTKACQRVQEAGAYCSVWKAVRHSDGREVDDVTEDVKEHL